MSVKLPLKAGGSGRAAKLGERKLVLEKRRKSSTHNQSLWNKVFQFFENGSATEGF